MVHCVGLPATPAGWTNLTGYTQSPGRVNHLLFLDGTGNNILAGADGPVIIDLPQAVDAAGNNHAERMLERDVANLRTFFGRFAPELLATDYGGEIWSLYEAGTLSPEVSLTGVFDRPRTAVDLESVQREIEDIRLEEDARVRRLQEVDS